MIFKREKETILRARLVGLFQSFCNPFQFQNGLLPIWPNSILQSILVLSGNALLFQSFFHSILSPSASFAPNPISSVLLEWPPELLSSLCYDFLSDFASNQIGPQSSPSPFIQIVCPLLLPRFSHTNDPTIQGNECRLSNFFFNTTFIYWKYGFCFASNLILFLFLLPFGDGLMG